MTDLIERQAAIEAVEKTMVDMLEDYLCYDVVTVLKSMPSAEPKHGHWVYKDGVRGFGLGAWCCSECGEENESLPFHKCRNPYEYAASKYCACCGARMDKDD